jgi:hypothetical protein
VTPLETADSAYGFQLVVDGKDVLAFRSKKDQIAAIREALARILKILAGLPALLAVLSAYQRELTEWLRGLFGILGKGKGVSTPQ